MAIGSWQPETNPTMPCMNPMNPTVARGEGFSPNVTVWQPSHEQVPQRLHVPAEGGSR
ncbi:hypothetical protein [Comamonas sp. JC664]|uniref:hypothetical protein n=1 Tax=Comamonas sp. JC664 TaxID=2801917 RepID=UPI00174E8BA9|nr:hypothetical protein [Comamonas sp. JC664]MBL0698559.1 hypothetical protein [Comamonas sp. JC664]GHH00479.1 hypothetical protein GCM10012319_67650 [Comamonas sp. KCTC 72670]